ncbi:MAG TPA: TetR family transcriptional regulator [Rhizomicrobium sp.]|nr:TetR family transcriptional regulator [Rhizomicrobium sp.]
MPVTHPTSAVMPARAPASARSRKHTAKSEDTRGLLLEAAVDSLMRHGYRGTNLLRIATIAGVTRGCLQYYFLTTDEVMLALARYVEERHWQSYTAEVSGARTAADPIEAAIDMVASPVDDRYRLARLELVVASRTNPALAAVLQDAACRAENWQREFTGKLFGSPHLADTPAFRGARDLTSIVDDWMFIHAFPGNREQRMQGVRDALRIALHALWDVEIKSARAAGGARK